MTDSLSTQGRLVQSFFAGTGELVARWTRLEVSAPAQLPDPPALIVANHGFGGIFDLNAFVLAALAQRLKPSEDTQVTILTHQLAWTLGVGRLLEPGGFRPAGRQAAEEGFAAGRYVIVLPGGDIDAGKDVRRRNKIVFAGRTGFAKLALEAGVPIIPIVISGAGDTLLVLSDGQKLAQRTGVSRLARLKTLPVSISIPWGLNVGVAGMAPYLPVPAKMRAAVLDPITAGPDEGPTELASRVEQVMQASMTDLTEGRLPVLGWRLPRR